MLLQALALLACPLALGALAGIWLRRVRNARIGGVLAALACLLLPAVIALGLTLFWPLVGLWDAATEGLLVGMGLVATAHRAFENPRAIVLSVVSGLFACLLLELAARLLLPAPPAYPVEQGPHLLLATALRMSAPDGNLFKFGRIPPGLVHSALLPLGQEPEQRPASAMATREIVCSVAYGAAYQAQFRGLQHFSEALPAAFVPRPGATRRVLHVGDSMVYGVCVERGQTFAAQLERLEPTVQHINGGISGTAPDDYFVILNRWVERVPIDLAVLYLFAGNDVAGIDSPHPCSDWQSLLTYEHGQVGLRFPKGPHADPDIGWRWLLANSPLPFLAKVLVVRHSFAVAYLGSLLDSWSAGAAWVPPRSQFDHVEAILRTAQASMQARKIPLVVVILPATEDLRRKTGGSLRFAKWAGATCARLGVPVLDASQPVLAALARGEDPTLADGFHFNAAGHLMMANWLHERLGQLR